MSKENDSNPDVEEVLEGDDTNETEGSSDFFDSLEQQVNGAVSDDNIPQPETEQVTQQADPVGTGNEVQTDWKSKAETLEKRYGDSTREAQKLKAENDNLSELSKFKPLIEHLKSSPDAVQALKDSIGGKPRSLTERFGEDFVFDAHEAMSDTASDSAKLMNAHVDRLVQGRVSQMIGAEKERAAKTQAEINQKGEEKAFRDKHDMTDEEYNGFVDKAKEHILTLEDIHYLLNKDKTAANTANSTKKDMLTQMKNVRNIPTSASGANSQGSKEQSMEDNVFNALKSVDDDLDNLFG